MVIEFDKQAWQEDARESGELVHLDWACLRARLLAARETRRAVAAGGGSAGRSASLGSFAGPAARWIISFGEKSTFVNPNDSANRNAGEAIKDCVSGASRTGDRE